MGFHRISLMFLSVVTSGALCFQNTERVDICYLRCDIRYPRGRLRIEGLGQALHANRASEAQCAGIALLRVLVEELVRFDLGAGGSHHPTLVR